MNVKAFYLREGGKCFFCKKRISLTNASLEHIVPVSKKGKNTQDNLLLICKQMNGLLCNYDIKRKLEIVFNQVDAHGVIRCPMTTDDDALTSSIFDVLNQLN